jgi:hypothetical protein
MKKVHFLAFLFSIFAFPLFAQNVAPAVQWEKGLGGGGDDKAYTVQQTKDGGFIVAGTSNSKDGDVGKNMGGFDIWILKMDSLGNTQWKKTMGGSENDYVNYIQQTKDGGYIFAGSVLSNDGDISGNHGLYDVWVVKLNQSGVVLWQKTLGGASIDEVSTIKQTKDGGYVISGWTKSSNGDVSENLGGYDYWILKLNANGAIVWNRVLGGSNDDRAYYIMQTRDGSYMVAGYSKSNDGNATGNHGGYDMWLLKLSAEGDIVWQKSYGGGDDDGAFCIQETSDGGYIAAGFAKSLDGDVTENRNLTDYWIVKLASNGEIEWQKTMGGLNDDYATSIQQTDDGGYIIVGQTNSIDGDVKRNHGSYDFWIVKLDEIGLVEWQKTVGKTEDDEAYHIQQTRDRGYIVAGYSKFNGNGVVGNDNYDFWVIKFQGKQRKL